VIRDIAGRQNHSVKLARKLQKKKHRRERRLLVGEGMDLLRAAAEAEAPVCEILVRRDLFADLPLTLVDAARESALGGPQGVDIGICDEETLAHASALGGSADVVFMCRELRWGLSDLDLAKGLTLVLDGVGDPGNVGTLVRGCAAFGGAGVVCTPGTADPYGPKALRAGMGAQFVVRVVTEVTPADLAARMESLRLEGSVVPQTLVAEPCGGEELGTVELEGGAVVVMGAERVGPGSDWSTGRRVTIPQRRFDSLNVAMAGTILLYELSRGRPGAA